MVDNYLASFPDRFLLALQVATSTMVRSNGYFSDLEGETHLPHPPQLDWGLGAGRKAVTTVVSAADTHAPCTTFAQVWESKFSSPMHSSQHIGSTVWIVSCVIKLHSSFLKPRQVCRALILLIILLLLILFNQKPTAC